MPLRHRNRQPRPPDEVVAGLRLPSGEKALAWASDAEGSWFIGTALALYLPEENVPADQPVRHRRLGWERVERADWDSEHDRLAVVEVDDLDGGEQVTVLTTTEPGRLLELVRERITKSIVWSAYATVSGSRGLRVVARRSPSGRGPVTWSYLVAAGLDPDDPRVDQVAAEAIEQGRRELAGL